MKLKATERRHCGFPGSPLLSHWLLQWLHSVSIGYILNLHTFSFFFFLFSFGLSEFLTLWNLSHVFSSQLLKTFRLLVSAWCL